MSTTVPDVAGQADTWDHFLESSRPDVGFKQSSWWCDFLNTRGWDSFGVALREQESDQIVGGVKVLRKEFAPGKCFYYVPHGPVLPDADDAAAEAFEAIMAYIDRERKLDRSLVSHLRIEPLWITRPDFVREYQETSGWLDPRHTLLVDLSLSEDAILARMKQKGRYNIRVARRKGVTIVEDTSSRGVDDFVEIYQETFARHGLRGHSVRYFRGLTERLTAFDCGTIYFAECEGKRLAGGLVISFGDTVTYKYGGSLLERRDVMAPYLLHFEILMRAKAGGCRWYDFGGIAPPGASEDRWAGFSAFKRKFGGIERNYVPAMDFIYDDAAYEDYRNRK